MTSHLLAKDSRLPVNIWQWRWQGQGCSWEVARCNHFWEWNLRASGGSLRPGKYYWYFLAFTWHNGVNSFKNVSPPPIFHTDDDNKQVPIQYITPGSSMKAVGVCQDTSGTSKKQLTTLITKIQNTHQSLQNSHLPRHLSWVDFLKSYLDIHLLWPPWHIPSSVRCNAIQQRII